MPLTFLKIQFYDYMYNKGISRENKQYVCQAYSGIVKKLKMDLKMLKFLQNVLKMITLYQKLCMVY